MRVLDLLDEHEVLAATLIQIRTAVFDRRMEDVSLWMPWLEATLRAHIELEETHLLPVYDTLPNHPANATTRVFRREHQQLLDTLDLLDLNGSRVALCDGLCKLQGLLEHHDSRESQSFKPRLDAHLDPALADRWLSAHKQTVDALGPLPPGTGTIEPKTPLPTAGTPIDRARDALAHGEADRAIASLDGTGVSLHPKSTRLRDACKSALAKGDLATAWDRVRLLQIVLLRPTSPQSESL